MGSEQSHVKVFWEIDYNLLWFQIQLFTFAAIWITGIWFSNTCGNVIPTRCFYGSLGNFLNEKWPVTQNCRGPTFAIVVSWIKLKYFICKENSASMRGQSEFRYHTFGVTNLWITVNKWTWDVFLKGAFMIFLWHDVHFPEDALSNTVQTQGSVKRWQS